MLPCGGMACFHSEDMCLSQTMYHRAYWSGPLAFPGPCWVPFSLKALISLDATVSMQ